MSRQSSSFCLIWPTTRPQSLWNLKEAKTLHANDKIRDVTVAWHQSPQWGKKAKIISKQREPAEWESGEGKGQRLATFPPFQSTARLASLTDSFLFYLVLCLFNAYCGTWFQACVTEVDSNQYKYILSCSIWLP